MSIWSVILFDKGRPYVTPSTNTVATILSNQLMFSYVSGGMLLVRPELSDSVLGGTILALVNIAIVPVTVVMGMRDHKARAEKNESFQKLRKKLDVCTTQDRKKYVVVHDRA